MLPILPSPLPCPSPLQPARPYTCTRRRQHRQHPRRELAGKSELLSLISSHGHICTHFSAWAKRQAAGGCGLAVPCTSHIAGVHTSLYSLYCSRSGQRQHACMLTRAMHYLQFEPHPGKPHPAHPRPAPCTLPPSPLPGPMLQSKHFTIMGDRTQHVGEFPSPGLTLPSSEPNGASACCAPAPAGNASACCPPAPAAQSSGCCPPDPTPAPLPVPAPATKSCCGP